MRLTASAARRSGALFAALITAAGCDSGARSPQQDGAMPRPPRSAAATAPAFTLHYHRALADYAGWTVQVSAGAVETSASSASTDGFGAVYALTVASGATSLAITLANGAVTDAAGALAVDVSGSVREAWVFSGYSTAVTSKLPAIPGTNQVAVYYTRVDKSYSGWGLHTWGLATDTVWTTPLQPKGIDPALGEGFVIDLKPAGGAQGNCPAAQVCISE